MYDRLTNIQTQESSEKMPNKKKLKKKKPKKSKSKNKIPKIGKMMHAIVLFIEPTDEGFTSRLKIGNLLINRFAIDEDASF